MLQYTKSLNYSTVNPFWQLKDKTLAIFSFLHILGHNFKVQLLLSQIIFIIFLLRENICHLLFALICLLFRIWWVLGISTKPLKLCNNKKLWVDIIYINSSLSSASYLTQLVFYPKPIILPKVIYKVWSLYTKEAFNIYSHNKCLSLPKNSHSLNFAF